MLVSFFLSLLLKATGSFSSMDIREGGLTF